MKVLILLLTGEDDEPNLRQEFINGYESSGLTWNGDITLLEDISAVTITDEYLAQYYNTGYELLLRNTAPAISKLDVYKNAREGGMLFVSPVGNNVGIANNDFNNNEIIVMCGSGMPELGNQTGYPCMFFDTNETESVGLEIADLRQCGTSYNLTHIRRHSSTQLAFKIDGLTGDYGSIGLHLSGTPVYFSGLSGSDISPLPNGLKYCSNAGNNFFFAEHTTTAGTINTGFNLGDYQALSAGSFTFGNLDSGKVLIRTETGTTFPQSGTFGNTAIKDVAGFVNNITDGIYPITDIPNGRGYYNMIMIAHTLGTGAFESGGRVFNISQSYSHAYIGGKLAAIKDITGDDWSTVIGKAIKTASGNGSRDSVDGYGVINVAKASNAQLGAYIYSLDAPVLNEITDESLTWNLIPMADEYEVYFRNELYATLKAHITTLTITDLPRQSKGRLNNFKVRAISNISTSDFSNEREYNYYYYSGIKVVDYA